MDSAPTQARGAESGPEENNQMARAVPEGIRPHAQHGGGWRRGGALRWGGGLERRGVAWGGFVSKRVCGGGVVAGGPLRVALGVAWGPFRARSRPHAATRA